MRSSEAFVSDFEAKVDKEMLESFGIRPCLFFHVSCVNVLVPITCLMKVFEEFGGSRRIGSGWLSYIVGVVQDCFSFPVVCASANVVSSSLRSPSLPGGRHVVDTYGILPTGVSHGGDATATSHSQAGYTHQTNRPVTLDFEAGIIRHQMTAGDEGSGTLDDVVAKVGDHGLSRTGQRPSQQPRWQRLDVSFFMPGSETSQAVVLVNGSSNKVSDKVDVLSFGVVLWEILTREEPYANMHFGVIIGLQLRNTSLCDKKREQEFRYLAYDNDFVNLHKQHYTQRTQEGKDIWLFIPFEKKIIYHKVSGRSSGLGFVTMSSVEDVGEGVMKFSSYIGFRIVPSNSSFNSFLLNIPLVRFREDSPIAESEGGTCTCRYTFFMVLLKLRQISTIWNIPLVRFREDSPIAESEGVHCILDAPTPLLPGIPTTPERGCSSTATLNEEDLVAITELPATQITPPPGTDESTEKANYQPEGSSQAACKQLFTQVHEQTSEQPILPADTTGQEQKTMPTPPPQLAIAEPEDIPITQAIQNQSTTNGPQQL
ncbi:serine/threonine-protein kinase HT1 [Artemisia annua]|uniref:Serine/threonine-protein kinase HT1 n=1 Tax=Artemisia annua TaxID=35608 RepID=A0A2U1MRL6_ARTAN|nr:serine/threonine-protein kinase HT1 [Artemisia annua]